MRTEEEWLDFHQFSSMGQALRQIMNYVDNEAWPFSRVVPDGEVVIFTNLKRIVESGWSPSRVVDMDTMESV